MSNVLPTLISITKNNTKVQSVCSGRIYADYIPEGSVKPSALLYATYEDAFDCLENFLPVAISTVRFESYGDTRQQANDLAEAIEESLNGYTGTIAGDTIHIHGVSRQTGQIHLVDIPNDGTDNWQFRSVQSFDVSYEKL